MTHVSHDVGQNLSVGEVLGQLRTEFPDATVSKLRFLEAEGLVTPHRSPSGYRRYSEGDVTRLRYILAAQRDHYLPLRVIKEYLTHAGVEELAEFSTPPPREETQRHVVEQQHHTDLPEPATPSRMKRDDLLAHAEIDDQMLFMLEQFDLLKPDTEGVYPPEAATIAAVAAQLAAYGIEPRHLRGSTTAAERFAELCAAIVAPLSRQRDGQQRADTEASELAALSVRLYDALVHERVRSRLGAQ